MSDSKTTAHPKLDAARRADAMIQQAVDEASPHISKGTMILHWRVQRALSRLIAAALEERSYAK